MAFPLSDYDNLLTSLRESGYLFAPVRSYFEDKINPCVFVRHDVDRMVWRAVAMAEVESKHGIASTYYFRCSAQGVFPEAAIKKVADLGHEVGYHYETVVRARGDLELARELFEKELKQLRETAEIVTVAAHGSPFSDYSNMGYTEGIDLKQFDIIGEPSIDIDFSEVLYVTDTGGMFGSPYNVRDKVQGKNFDHEPCSADKLGTLLDPQKEPVVLLNCHPERWPENIVGLIQAQAADIGVNVAKKLAGRC